MQKYFLGIIIFLCFVIVISLFPPFICNDDFKRYDFIFLQNNRFYEDGEYTFSIKLSDYKSIDTSDIINKVLTQKNDTTYSYNLDYKYNVEKKHKEWDLQKSIQSIDTSYIYNIKKPYWHSLRRRLLTSELLIEYLLAFVMSALVQFSYYWKINRHKR